MVFVMVIKMNPEISVIIITYNHEKYISQAIKSVVNQKCQYTYEILIGNDCSTDGTQDIVGKFDIIYPEIAVFNRKENMGASKNLYDLLCRARGKYIALLEGDDYWIDPEKLQMQIEFLEKHTEYIGCSHRCQVVDEAGNRLKRQKMIWEYPKQIFTLEDSQCFYLSGQTSTLVFKNIFLSPIFDYSIIYQAHPLISDRTLQMVLAMHGKLYRIDRCMSNYRQILKRDGKNATSALFVDKTDGDYVNFHLTQILEGYLKKELGRAIDCESIKRSFFAACFLKTIIFPTRHRRDMFRRMLKDCNEKKVSYILLLPYEILKRLTIKVKLMEV